MLLFLSEQTKVSYLGWIAQTKICVRNWLIKLKIITFRNINLLN